MKIKKIKNRWSRDDIVFRRMFFSLTGDIEEYKFTFGHDVDEVFTWGNSKVNLFKQWKIRGHNVMIGFDIREIL